MSHSLLTAGEILPLLQKHDNKVKVLLVMWGGRVGWLVPWCGGVGGPGGGGVAPGSRVGAGLYLGLWLVSWVLAALLPN